MILTLTNVENSRALYDELNQITKAHVTEVGDVVYVCSEGYDLLVYAVCLEYGTIIGWPPAPPFRGSFLLCYNSVKGGFMEQVKENVKEWERTRSIRLAGDTMELLIKIFKEEDGED